MAYPALMIRELARRERDQLCRLMLELGADAPTLNEGWKVLDLAAHLVVRERAAWAAPGIVLGGPFRLALDIAMNRRRRQGLARLVEIIEKGEPYFYRRFVPAGAQLVEYYVHHEDVRRPNGLPARADADLDAALARVIRAAAGRYLARVPVAVEVWWGEEALHQGGEGPRACLRGNPGELIIYLTGRRQAAHVEIDGDSTAVSALAEAELGI